jgi:hypothetical protein
LAREASEAARTARELQARMDAGLVDAYGRTTIPTPTTVRTDAEVQELTRRAMTGDVNATPHGVGATGRHPVGSVHQLQWEVEVEPFGGSKIVTTAEGRTSVVPGKVMPTQQKWQQLWRDQMFRAGGDTLRMTQIKCAIDSFETILAMPEFSFKMVFEFSQYVAAQETAVPPVIYNSINEHILAFWTWKSTQGAPHILLYSRDNGGRGGRGGGANTGTRYCHFFQRGACDRSARECTYKHACETCGAKAHGSSDCPQDSAGGAAGRGRGGGDRGRGRGRGHDRRQNRQDRQDRQLALTAGDDG